MINQLKALIGSVAAVIQRSAGGLLGFVGLRSLARWTVPALVLLLVVGAVLSASATLTILGSRPEVTRATLTEVAAHDEGGESVWYEFDALVDSSSLATQADLGTFFYLARDPADPDQGLLVRSPLNDLSFRQRVLGATLVEDADVVASALEQFGSLPGGFTIDDARYLEETEAGGDPDEAFDVSELRDEDAGGNVLVNGRVVAPDRFVVPDGDAYLYLFADVNGTAAIVLRSPYPPDALPVRLQGLYLRDSFDLAPVLESPWFAAIDAEVPTDRALQAGYRPPITVDASWVPTIIYGGLALLLLASFLIGYPVFGASRGPAPGRSLSPGEGVDVDITGRMAGRRALIALDSSPGAVERLTIEDLALRMWRYGMLEQALSRRDAERRFVEEAGDVTDRLVLHERDQSALVVVDRGGGSASVAVGRLHRVGRSVPAIHFRQGETDAYLAARSDADRDRAAAEIAGEAAGTTG